MEPRIASTINAFAGSGPHDFYLPSDFKIMIAGKKLTSQGPILKQKQNRTTKMASKV